MECHTADFVDDQQFTVSAESIRTQFDRQERNAMVTGGPMADEAYRSRTMLPGDSQR